MTASPGIPADLAPAFHGCARVTRARSSSYWLATAVLPRTHRPFVHALYAFARRADDLVDHPGTDPAGALDAYRSEFRRAVAGGSTQESVLDAVAYTIDVWDLPLGAFDRFFRSMEMDLTVVSYESWDDLLGYMDGSAAAIGELMLPILEPEDRGRAFGPARDLGLAFQLTNFLRDIDEDLDRGRQYVPQADLRRFGVDLTARRATPEFAELMEFEIERCRRLYESADDGITLLPARSARCVRLASELYQRILTRIEDAGGDVFTNRARVPGLEKARVVVKTLARH